MAISESIQVPLRFHRTKPHNIIHKCHFDFQYITVEYRQPSFVNFQCVLRRLIFDIIRVLCMGGKNIFLSGAVDLKRKVRLYHI